MMHISKYNKFLKELNESRVFLPVLDVVIDNFGNVLNGENGQPLVKGRVERKDGKVTRILGDDNKNYIAGIDKNGNVIALSDNIVNDRVVGEDGSPISVPNEIRDKYNIDSEYYYVSDIQDYYTLIPILPTGWVNVKIDMEIVKRVRRYSKSLGTNTRGHQSFIDKLHEFEELSSKTRKDQYIKMLKRGRIQKEMSCILLLQHINELKDFFNPSQSGFLFESFIAGLIPNSRIKEDNSPVDIKTTTGDGYQCKLVDFKTQYVDITMDGPTKSDYLDYYIIALKYVDKIELFIIDGHELEDLMSSGNGDELVTAGVGRGGDSIKKRFKVSKIMGLFGGDNNNNNINVNRLVRKFTIDLSDISGRIKNLGEDLKRNLDKIYDELSRFQFNVETIVTGTNEQGVPIKSQEEFDVYHSSAEENIKNLSEHLTNLVGDINK